jgi:hypothetical protein
MVLFGRHKYLMRNKDALTEKWIRENGMDVKTFNVTHPKLLQAQKVAHTLLTQHAELLNPAQTRSLHDFQRRMANKRSRQALKPTAAYPILNIGTKINRHLFSAHRQINKAQ